ncbi:alpha/beta hydrolase [Salipaludibacillus aurantiacus]|uniref:Serine aminopeptidase S33 domain-containing protein n=1 Tax=Salipaludibacillus aurantiacus TaxID=1601833 RepID=A0A1H9WFT0_9BACI|nr:alpha/beta hydrolase [Salipaludibacillus aurantiacus]SES32649.1 hypothetical protein SAMN05518684_116102 [Salipaludibacillus aurantiacus]
MTVVMNKWLLAPLILLAIIGLLFILLYFFQARLIFFPQSITQHEAEQITGQYERAEEISFHADGGNQLHGWLLHPEQETGKNRLLIYYGGNAEELSAQIPMMTERLDDWSVLLVNYRGYGKSEGRPEEENLYNDALLIYDVIQDEFDNGLDSTVLMGRSIGTGIATKVAAERHADGLVLVSPFDSLEEVASRHYSFLPVSLLLRFSFDSVSRINEISGPLLVITGDEDEIVPESHTEALLKDYTGSLQYEQLQGRGHNDLHLDPQFWKALREFLRSK